MAAVKIMEDDSALAARPCEAIMKSHNQIIQCTVGDGACGLDLMCMMLGLEQHEAVSNNLRIELRDYLMLHAHDPWMWTLKRWKSQCETNGRIWLLTHHKRKIVTRPMPSRSRQISCSLQTLVAPSPH